MLYLIIAHLFPSKLIYEILNTILAAVGFLVVIVYGPQAFVDIYKNKIDNTTLFRLGVVFCWGSVWLGRWWNVIWSHHNMPDWMMYNHISGFMCVVATLGGLIHITMPVRTKATLTWLNWFSTTLIMLGFTVVILGIKELTPVWVYLNAEALFNMYLHR